MRQSVTLLLLAAISTCGAAAARTCVAAPPASLQEDDSPAAGVIKGMVQKNGRTVRSANIRVEIVGLGSKFRKKINSDGTFSFTDVPAGTYVLKASGSFKNMEVSGELKDVKPASEEDAEDIAVSVE
ncbi:MAG: carboxypeptidase regulatory-like domain-containing protein [Planctomyces sp.]|nr:carboxypeptidase regulatory-like domain-containing protein [Planctomyces sp.]